MTKVADVNAGQQRMVKRLTFVAGLGEVAGTWATSRAMVGSGP